MNTLLLMVLLAQGNPWEPFDKGKGKGPRPRPVPEFTTIAYVATLFAAGAVVYYRKKK